MEIRLVEESFQLEFIWLRNGAKTVGSIADFTFVFRVTLHVHANLSNFATSYEFLMLKFRSSDLELGKRDEKRKSVLSQEMDLDSIKGKFVHLAVSIKHIAIISNCCHAVSIAPLPAHVYLIRRGF